MSGLDLTAQGRAHLMGEQHYPHIRLDFVDCDCILKRNVCVKGLSLKDWSIAVIYENDRILDRVKTQGLTLFNFPQLHEGTIIRVKTNPPTEWALIVALAIHPQDGVDNENLDFYTPLSEGNCGKGFKP